MFGFLKKIKSLWTKSSEKKNSDSTNVSDAHASGTSDRTEASDHPKVRIFEIPIQHEVQSDESDKSKKDISAEDGLPPPPREMAGVVNIPSAGARPPLFDFLDSLFEEMKKEEEQAVQTSLDGSADLNEAIEEAEAPKYDESKYPELFIYGGHNGSFELIEKGKERRIPIEGNSFSLPLDTDIVRINAYHIANQGDWYDVSSIGDMTLNAQAVTLRNCYALKKLPPLKSVATLILRNCPQFRTFHPTSQVARVQLENCGVCFIPKSLKESEIFIRNCPHLRYVHPAVPNSHFETLRPDFVNALKVNYFLSEDVPDKEKNLYQIPLREVVLDDNKLSTIPECFSKVSVIAHHCPKLKYVHPAIQPEKVKGISPKELFKYQMNYLFDKVPLTDDAVFNHWFPVVKARMRE